MALIMAMPMMFALPEAASAATYDASSLQNKILEWDFVSAKPSITITNTTGENRGTVPSSGGSRSCNLSLECWSNGDNLWRYDGSDGMKSDDGVAWIENLGDYLEANKDIDIRFTIATRNNIGDSTHGIFCIGSSYVDSGDEKNNANNLVYLDNTGELKYDCQNSNTSIYVGNKTQPTSGTFYNFRIYFDNAQHRLNIYRDGFLLGSVQNNSLSKSNFGTIAFGVNRTNKWNKNTIRYISISQPTIKDADSANAVDMDTIGSISKQTVNASVGAVHSGNTNAGAVKQNVLYPNAGGAPDSDTYNNDLSNNSNTRMKTKFMFPSLRFVYSYDGSNSAFKIPVIVYVNKDGGTLKKYAVDYIAVDNANWKMTNSLWYKCSDWNNWNQTVTGSVNDTTIISSDPTHDHTNFNSGNRDSANGTDGSNYLSNYVEYKGSVDTSQYYTTLSVPTFTIKYDGWASWWEWGTKYDYYNLVSDYPNIIRTGMVPCYNKGTVVIKVMNYAKIGAVIDEINGSDFQALVTDVKTNASWKYTADSVKKFYAMLNRVKNFSINSSNYDYSSDKTVEAVADEMKSIVRDFNSYGEPTKKNFTITYVDKNGSSSTATVLAGNTLANKTSGASVPSLPSPEYVSNNKHNTYSYSSSGVWDDSTTPAGNHIPHSNETYTVNTTLVNCTGAAGTPVAATSEHNGYTPYECTVCHHETSRTYNPLNWGTYDTNKSAYDTATTTDAALYTDDTLTACTTAVTSAISGINRATMTGANTPQSTVNTAATAISDALANLKGRAAFGALDTAKTTAMNWASAEARRSEYTSSSIQAYKDYLNSTTQFPYENNASRTNTPVDYQSAIDAEVTKYGNAQAYALENILDPLADLTYFDAEYDKANTFLLNLNGKTAEYTEESVQALVNAVTAAADPEGSNKSVQTIASANAAARADFGQAVQTDATTFANNIKTAMDGLQKVETIVAETVDTSAFDAAVAILNNIDPDAYDVTEGDVDSIRRSANATISTEENQITYGNAHINVLNGSITQQNLNDATSVIATALTVHTKLYTITKDAEGSTDFTVSSRGGTSYGSGDSAEYGTTIIASTNDNSEVAWYLEIRTGSMWKKLAFQGYGKRLSTKVLGNTRIKAVKNDGTKSKVTIYRTYDSKEVGEKSPIQVVDYVSGSYTLPVAPAIAFYSFDKYYIGENDVYDEYAAGDEVTINEDTVIIAKYDAAPGADCAINVLSDETQNQTVAYNTKVTLTGAADTYAWVEAIDATHFRPFKIGKDVEFLASESTELKAVTKSEFDAFKFTFPCINLRQDGIIESGGKKVFNAQLVNDGKEVQEYGILVAAPYGSNPISMSNLLPSMVVIENSGKHADGGYQILRAKSTKLVGASQFTISVSSLPENYIYRGYAIYKDANGNLQTVYSEAMR